MLRRFTLITRTTIKKEILILAFGCDVLSLVTSFIGLPVFIEAIPLCEFSYSTFMLMLVIYQFLCFLRLIILLCHFVYGKRFWRHVKRCFSCLNTVEYE